MFHEARKSIDEHSIKISLNEIFYLSLPVIVFVISTLYWGNILWLKYNSLHDYVFDSGLFLDSLYQILYFHTSATLISYLGSSPDRIIFAPLSYFHSILFLLYFQLFAVLGSTFIVFFAIKTLTKNSGISSVVSVLYLIYFPIDGSLFFFAAPYRSCSMRYSSNNTVNDAPNRKISKFNLGFIVEPV